MANICYYIPNHGYVENDIVWVAYLQGYYYVDDPDTDSFYLTDGADGDNLEYSTTITDGWMRQVATNSGVITIRNLGHLEGEKVVVTANGNYRGTYTVSNAQITLTDHVFTYQVGKLYACKIKTMRFAVPGSGNEATRIKKIGKQTVRYVRAKNIQVGQELDGVEYMENLAATYKSISQDKETLNRAGHDHDGYSLVKSVEPFPMTVLGIIVDIEITEKG